jgi:hypothetical protein
MCYLTARRDTSHGAEHELPRHLPEMWAHLPKSTASMITLSSLSAAFDVTRGVPFTLRS